VSARCRPSESCRAQDGRRRTDNLAGPLDGVTLLDKTVRSEDRDTAAEGGEKKAGVSLGSRAVAEVAGAATHTLSASRFRHMPRTPEANSTISSASSNEKRQGGRQARKATEKEKNIKKNRGASARPALSTAGQTRQKTDRTGRCAGRRHGRYRHRWLRERRASVDSRKARRRHSPLLLESKNEMARGAKRPADR
jgi:hypothetical protein